MVTKAQATGTPTAKAKALLDAAFLDAHRRAVQAGYPPAGYFMQMFQERGAVETARALIFSSKPASGYTRLWEMGRLDLSVEAIVIDGWESWEILFRDTPTIYEAARKRLADYGYRVP